MNSFEYVVESLDGDYANLRRADEEDGELKLVAREIGRASCRERVFHGV